jgi:hypothetical protein
MSLKEAHNIGEELQKKIERIPEVERVCRQENFLLIKTRFFS